MRIDFQNLENEGFRIDVQRDAITNEIKGIDIYPAHYFDHEMVEPINRQIMETFGIERIDMEEVQATLSELQVTRALRRASRK